MPLTRATVTASSRVMLPVYACLSGYLGACYAFGDPRRTASSSLDVIREVLPGGIATWGYFLLALTALKLTALALRSRRLMIVALCLGFAAYVAWASGIATASLTIPDASLTGPAVWLFIAVAHIASLQSLTKDSAG